MPIAKHLRHFYGQKWKTETRPRILARAGNCCEECGAPNGKTVLRTFSWWTPANVASSVFYQRGRINGKEITELEWAAPGVPPQLLGFPRECPVHWVGIVLTVAHLNHTPGDDRDENLKALCQWCHLNYDKMHHRESRQTRKDAARPILTAAQATINV